MYFSQSFFFPAHVIENIRIWSVTFQHITSCTPSHHVVHADNHGEHMTIMATVEEAYVQSLAADASARLGRALNHKFNDFHLKMWQLELLPLIHQTSCVSLVFWCILRRWAAVTRRLSRPSLERPDPKRLLHRWTRRTTLVKKMKGRKWPLSLSRLS